MGKYLKRAFDWGGEFVNYNEIIIDPGYWRGHMPGVIEAIVGDAGVHARFLKAYGLSSDTHPLVHYTGNRFY